MKIEELLPIGSVVRLKEGTKKLMIFGVKQRGDQEGTEHDYVGVLYPEGNMGLLYQYFFAHENIEEVFFRGFEDSERKDFIEKLDELYQKQETAAVSIPQE
jgi:hypothetical protein